MAEKKVDSTGVDFAQFSSISDAASEGRWFEPFHPGTGEPLGCEILVYGEDSKHFARAMDNIAQHRAQVQQRTGREEANYSDLSYGRLILAMFLTGDWKGIVSDGKPLECNEITKRELYKNNPWLAEMVVEFARKRLNFLKH